MKQVGISLLGVMSLVTVANASQGTLSHEEIVNNSCYAHALAV